MVQDVLAKFEVARKALAEAKSVDEVKDIRDRAEALRLYVKQAGESLEMQNHCAEIKLRAERRIGELLAATVRPGNPQLLHDGTISRLPNGISRTQSYRYQTIAHLPETTFEAHIVSVKAKREELTTADLLRRAHELKREEERQQRQTQEVPHLKSLGQYRTIMVDPPWHYEDQGSRISATNHYDTMSLEQIKAFPIKDLTAPNGCHLYLWTTNSFMREAYTVLDTWGYTAKTIITIITWVKTTRGGRINIGMGHYFRNATEHMIFAIHGYLPTRRYDEPNVIMAPRSHHSAKPEEAYALIERMSYPPYLEIFSRRQRPGWTTWGYEV